MEFEKKDIVPFEFHELVGANQVSLKYENTAKTYFIQDRNGVNKYLKLQPVASVE